MLFRFLPRDLPGRMATGAFILHSGIDKWNGSTAQAEGVHAMAAGAFPFLKSIPPERFLKVLAAGEVLTGALLLSPFVSNAVAGARSRGSRVRSSPCTPGPRPCASRAVSGRPRQASR